MTHLSAAGVPCPRPIPNRDGGVLGTLNGKPATLVSRLPGRDISAPSVEHCSEVGIMLARMHLAGQTYPATMPNPRGMPWWRAAALEVIPKMPTHEVQLLEHELAFQARLPPKRFRAVQSTPTCSATTCSSTVTPSAASSTSTSPARRRCSTTSPSRSTTGASDDVAELDASRTQALLAAYHAVRPIEPAERAAWPQLLRAGALRFWLSRLFDFHCPRPGELTYAKDPNHFRQVLEARRNRADQLQDLLPRT
jgi:homoserine kinase type II